jgi:phage-related protein
MLGLGSGIFEIALAFRGDAFRVVYAVQLAEELWVIHATALSRRRQSTPWE